MREPRASGHAPRNWGEAFAALPPETPAADALQAVLGQWPASTPKRRSLRLPLALAASLLALAAIVPFARHPGASLDPASTASSPRPTTPVAPQTTTSVAAPGPVPPQKATSVAASVASGVGAPVQKRPGPGSRRDDGRKDSATDATGPAQKQVAQSERLHREPHRTRKPVPSEPANDAVDKAALEPLYAESARLEALLALARDDRVSSATAVALGSDFEARVAGIDAALAQPALDAQRRLELWRDRVSALRAYASFESTQRALAASGERYDAMLVSID